jgi:probable O-glycosylation ligase (exosortase A-associated)
MRDIAITLVITVFLVYTFKRPHVGVLLWSWLGYMNPHRLCYGFAYSMPFSQITAIVTVISLLFSKEKKQLPKDKFVYLIMLFILWMGITTIFAFQPDEAWSQYIKILKIQLPILLTLLIFKTKERIDQLIWVIIVSLGYFGVKGGIFTLMTGGSFRVWGPPSSFVEENNSLAVALLMVMPLMIYMRSQLVVNWQKNAMIFSLIAMGFSVLGSQSRGAFLAISIVGLYFWLHSNSKMMSGVLIGLFIAVMIPFLPESWFQRMDTIGTYEEDASALGRINAWTLAFRVANHNLLGGGLNFWDVSSYSQYLEWFDPDSMHAYVAHSIYFSVLGEHGWIGLFLFLLTLYMAWSYCGQIVRQFKNNQELQWAVELAKMIKISLLAYCSGGAFLSLTYFDLPWHLMSIVILLKQLVHNHVSQSEIKYYIHNINEKNVNLKPKSKIDPQGYIR